MQNLTNVTIDKAYKGISGTSQHGEWQLWDFYLKDDKRKFSMFEKDEVPIPEQGMKIAFMEFEVKEVPGKGKHEGKTFTNYNVGKFVLADDPGADRVAPTHGVGAKHTPAPQEIGREAGIFASYHKDYVISLIKDYDTQEAIAANMDAIIQLADEFLDASITAGLRVTSAPEPNTESIDTPGPHKAAEISDPFGEKM